MQAKSRLAGAWSVVLVICHLAGLFSFSHRSFRFKVGSSSQDDGHRRRRKQSASYCVAHSNNPAVKPHFQRVEDNAFHHSFCSENERSYLETVSFGASEATRLR